VTTYAGRALAPGTAAGRAIVLDEGLSFWGGVDPEQGRVIDRHHPQAGADVAGTVLLMPSGRGSSSSSTVLAEAIRLGTAPAAVVLCEPDLIVALGSVVAARLYGVEVPVAVVGEAAYRSIRTGDAVTVEVDGETARLTVGD
jgi:uncharacterized protein